MSEFYIPKDVDVLKIDLSEHDAKVRADAIDEYSNELLIAVERCIANRKSDLNILMIYIT